MVNTNIPGLSPEETHFQVEEIAFYPFTANDASRYVFNVANPLEPVVDASNESVKRQLTNAYSGRASNLPMSHFFAVLLLRNELDACKGEPLNRDQLRRSMLGEYPDNKKSVIKLFKNFAEHKRKYIRRILYKDQPPVVLFPLYYVDGYPRHHVYRSQFVGFEYIKRMLVKEKIADPRFFQKTEINRMAIQVSEDPSSKYASWTLPTISDMNRLEKAVGKPLFDSITFPPGYERGRNAI